MRSPGTGDLNDIGIGQGKNYAVNVPLKDGIDDETYRSIFKPVSPSSYQILNQGKSAD